MRFPLIVLIALLALPATGDASPTKSSASPAGTISVTFINPDAKGNAFWDNFSSFMTAAAEDLGINFELIYADRADRFEYLRLAVEKLASPEPPDALITILKRNSSQRLFAECDKHQVDCFTVNTDLPATERKLIGEPRGKYTHWIGQTVPDDKSAGLLLANNLISQSRTLKPANAGAHGYMIALSGSGDSSAALQREEGLRESVQKHSAITLRQLIFTAWNPVEAYEKTTKLLQRYPETNIIWGASDAIALSAARAMQESNHVFGKDFVAGGIDWSHEGIEALAENRLSVSVGGHFIEGAIALILLFDRHHGKDFKAELGTRYPVQLKALSPDSSPELLKRLQQQKWQSIDFRQFSKTYNKRLTTYNFSIDHLLFDSH